MGATAKRGESREHVSMSMTVSRNAAPVPGTGHDHIFSGYASKQHSMRWLDPGRGVWWYLNLDLCLITVTELLGGH